MQPRSRPEELRIDWSTRRCRSTGWSGSAGAWTTLHGRRLQASRRPTWSMPTPHHRIGARRSHRGSAPHHGAARGQGSRWPFDAFARGAPGSPRSSASGDRRLMANARQVAYDCLRRIDHDGCLRQPGAAARARPLEVERARPTVRHRAGLRHDAHAPRRATPRSTVSCVKPNRSPTMRTLLRLGAYQLAVRRCARPCRGRRDRRRWRRRRPADSSTRCCARSATTPMEWPNDAVRLSYPDWIVDAAARRTRRRGRRRRWHE